MNLPKIRLKIIGLTLAVALLALVTTAYADAISNPLITVNEQGVGTLLFPGSPAIPLTGVLVPDPGPAGLALALTYDLLGPPSLVAGDLTVFDITGQIISELIRFNPAGAAQGYPASLVFYSDGPAEPGNLADSEFPSALYTNVFSLVEVGLEGGGNGVTYTPTPNQPGFVPGFGVSYVIQSDSSPVPEPVSMVLLGSGLAAGAFRARSRKGRLLPK